LLSAVQDDDPVVFLEHMKLYRSFRQEVPDEAYTIPIGKASIVKPGNDLTVVAYGAMVQTSMKAAEELEKERNITVEVIDLRTISPIDTQTILESVTKTHRAVVVSEAPRTGGVSAELVARISEKAILHLEAPVIRVTGYDTIYPFSGIEDVWLPTVERVKKGFLEALDF